MPEKTAIDRIADALEVLADGLHSQKLGDSGDDCGNVVDAIEHVAQGMHAIAETIQNLGTGNACTGGVGAIESLADRVAIALDGVAGSLDLSPLADALGEIGTALEGRKDQK